MHPNLMPSSARETITKQGERLSRAQIALLAGVWVALFAIGAVVTG